MTDSLASMRLIWKAVTSPRDLKEHWHRLLVADTSDEYERKMKHL